jgi:hypothetical protein
LQGNRLAGSATTAAINNNYLDLSIGLDLSATGNSKQE